MYQSFTCYQSDISFFSLSNIYIYLPAPTIHLHTNYLYFFLYIHNVSSPTFLLFIPTFIYLSDMTTTNAFFLYLPFKVFLGKLLNYMYVYLLIQFLNIISPSSPLLLSLAITTLSPPFFSSHSIFIFSPPLSHSLPLFTPSPPSLPPPAGYFTINHTKMLFI